MSQCTLEKKQDIVSSLPKLISMDEKIIKSLFKKASPLRILLSGK